MSYNFTDDVYENITQLPLPLIKIICIYSGDRASMSNNISANDIYNTKSWKKWHSRREWIWPKYEDSDIPSLGELKIKKMLKIFNKIYLDD